MNKLTATLITGGVGLAGTFFGMGVGYVSADGVPDTETVTESVPVEVPVEVVKWKTKEVPVEKEVEVIKEVEVTPQACLEAISAAEKLGPLMSDVVGISAEHVAMIPQAAKAGFNMNISKIEQITMRIETNTVDLENLGSDISSTIDEFNAAKAGC